MKSTQKKSARGAKTRHALVRSKRMAATRTVLGRPSARSIGPPALAPDVGAIRHGLGLTRRVFSRLCGYSERAVAEWESGRPLSDSSRQRMIEMDRLRKSLRRVMKPAFVGAWLQGPNEVFGGLKPLEVIERGELDRIWRMVYELESGQPG